MPRSTNTTYTCSAAAGCNQTFAKIADLRKHEARHSPRGHICTWPGCDFATMLKPSYDIHYAKHTGEQRYVCPQYDCDYRTHNPAQLTSHCKKCHGHLPSDYGTPSTAASGWTQSSSQTQSTQYQPQSAQSHPLPPIHNPFGVLYGPADTADDYSMYTGPARASHGWSEGCFCPELMERRPSELPGYEYRRY